VKRSSGQHRLVAAQHLDDGHHCSSSSSGQPASGINAAIKSLRSYVLPANPSLNTDAGDKPACAG